MSFRWIDLRDLGSGVPNQSWISVLPLLPVFNSELEINSALEMPQCLRKLQQDSFFALDFLFPGLGFGVNSHFKNMWFFIIVMFFLKFCFKINILWGIVFEYWFPKKTKLMWWCFLHVSLPVCPTSNNFWPLSNFNISEQSSEKQVHLDNKESVQDTEKQILLFQLLMEMLDSYVTYGFNLFLFQVGKSSF